MKKLLSGILSASLLLSTFQVSAQSSKPVYIGLQAGVSVPARDFAAYSAAVPGYQLKFNASKTLFKGLGLMAEAGMSQFVVNTDKLSHDLNNDYNASFITQSGSWESRYIMAGLTYTLAIKRFALQPYALAGYAAAVSPSEDGYYQWHSQMWAYSIQRSVGRNISYGGGLRLLANVTQRWTLGLTGDYYYVRSKSSPSYFTYQINNPWQYTISNLSSPVFVRSFGLSVGVVHVLGKKASSIMP